MVLKRTYEAVKMNLSLLMMVCLLLNQVTLSNKFSREEAQINGNII